MNKLKELWSNLRSNFWFMPSLIVVVSIGLAVVLIQADSTRSDRWLNQWPQLFGASAEGAREMMSTIAGSMMTVVGVSFSMILVVLALASGQYTSRILRNFMRSSATKIVLGIFAGIFTYCLIVLRTIRSADEGTFVPTLAVFFGFVMALVGVGTLMFFIHHIASSIQASNIISLIAKETNATINLLFPEKLGQSPDEEEDDEQTPRLLAKRNWCVIQSKKSGYIQNVNNDGLLRVARDWKTVVRMERGIGEFVVQNTPLVSLAMEEQPDQEKIAALQAAFSISRFRSVEQDPAFGIRQIVDVGLKALSPGINDTTTAVTCVDYLTSILAPMATRQIPSLHRYEKGELRVIAKGVSFESLLSESFNQIRNNANGNVAIILHMLDSFQTLAGLTTRTQPRRALLEQVQLIAELAERTVKSIYDRDRINTRLAEVKEILETDPVLYEG